MRVNEDIGVIGRLWLRVESLVNRNSGVPAPSGAGRELNPFYCLGAIGVFFLWVILFSGLYLFIFYRISATEAYASVERITHVQWYLGGVMRSLHRYASDGLVAVTVIHGLRHLALKRHANWRWVAWVSGVLTSVMVIAGGVFGYLMVWDEKAKLIAVYSSKLLEEAPFFGIPVGLTFALSENLTDQFFYIVLFIHFSSIIVIFMAVWIHLSRITKAMITPPKEVIYGLAFLLLLAAFVRPAVSDKAAELGHLVGNVSIDWFYMFLYPLMGHISPAWTIAVVVGAVFFVSVIPWVYRPRQNPTPSVAPDNCTGCELCREDCPYAAIKMVERKDASGYSLLASVMPERCASCGICAGACDYSAINLPGFAEEALKAEIKAFSSELVVNDTGILVFLCKKSADIKDKINGDGSIKGYASARVVELPCIGMLQPAMIDMAIDSGVPGVLAVGCRQGDCSFRTGNSWLNQRILMTRPPVVRRGIKRARIRTLWLSATETKGFFDGIERFRQDLSAGVKDD